MTGEKDGGSSGTGEVGSADRDRTGCVRWRGGK